MENCLLIINPAAGNGLGRAVAPELDWILAKSFAHTRLVFTRGEGDMGRIIAQYHDQADAVFVAGGDGTLNEAVNALAAYQFDLPLGYMPLGTVNDIGRVLKISQQPKEALRQLSQLTLQAVDIGRLNDHYFMNVVAVGQIPEAVKDTKAEAKKRLGKLAYVADGVQAFFQSNAQSYEIWLDGHQQLVETELILICLTNSVGGLEHMVDQARIDDGWLHLLILKDRHSLEFVPELLQNAIQGDISASKFVLYERAKHISLKALDHSISSNVDGDAGPSLPIQVDVLPGQLKLLVPKSTT
ncbi:MULTISPECIES: diacylglycerol kinase family protein [Aerococcus]|uniref:Diacylglycerol kinase family lipid kinase n=1 Tax=Aerococcus sanguinicola TaxID=119206 RepID=A0A5N1GPT7_9LACT|nr:MULTISPECIES: diacylglycerol kinase family protein [Aerococcus]KAA9302061.1 diacylglycerol kinase family lipid kinase [Aerococcus sanguinicola]MDK6368514.1 diacylglycerol kinase family lipid kinase [Aerococcus sp. UMB9870]MDK6679597.1 diacylglycerol kinase family lipid kinase [Aerococcus sp. UMB8608]MDK6686441.1 diacylglycerol kinase family lipid kinase [Aerococcus sp. UMB8623]MDK6940937.1 diacylglycerol kinase family lipid kinase [Aerococcus sp. UMB8487]